MYGGMDASAREQQFGESERNLSLAFVDDKHARVAYDDILWTKESAQQYLDQLIHDLLCAFENDHRTRKQLL